MKYIVFSVPDIPDTPIIFPDWIKHSTVGYTLEDDHMGPTGWKPISAGFVTELNGKFFVHGESESLKLSSEIKDADLITRIFKL